MNTNDVRRAYTKLSIIDNVQGVGLLISDVIHLCGNPKFDTSEAQKQLIESLRLNYIEIIKRSTRGELEQGKLNF